MLALLTSIMHHAAARQRGRPAAGTTCACNMQACKHGPTSASVVHPAGVLAGAAEPLLQESSRVLLAGSGKVSGCLTVYGICWQGCSPHHSSTECRVCNNNIDQPHQHKQHHKGCSAQRATNGCVAGHFMHHMCAIVSGAGTLSVNHEACMACTCADCTMGMPCLHVLLQALSRAGPGSD